MLANYLLTNPTFPTFLEAVCQPASEWIYIKKVKYSSTSISTKKTHVHMAFTGIEKKTMSCFFMNHFLTILSTNRSQHSWVFKSKKSFIEIFFGAIYNWLDEQWGTPHVVTRSYRCHKNFISNFLAKKLFIGCGQFFSRIIIQRREKWKNLLVLSFAWLTNSIPKNYFLVLGVDNSIKISVPFKNINLDFKSVEEVCVMRGVYLHFQLVHSGIKIP